MSGQAEILNTAAKTVCCKFRFAAFYFLAVITGLMLFISAALYVTDFTVFSPSRHLELASKYDIYSGVSKLTNKAIGDMSAALTGNSAKKSSNADGLSTSAALLAAGSTEQEKLIHLNVDNMITGMLKYFSGSSSFLPDIYLQLPDSVQKSSRASDSVSIAKSSQAASITSAVIDKINLSAFIMYTNRYDITDDFTFIRLLHDIAAKLPLILAAAALTGFLAGTLLKNRDNSLAGFVKLAAGTAGVSGLLLAGTLFYLLNITLPSVLTNQTRTISIPVGELTGYISDLLAPVLILFISSSLLLPAIFITPRAMKAFNGFASAGILNKIRKPSDIEFIGKSCTNKLWDTKRIPDAKKLKQNLIILSVIVFLTAVSINTASLLGMLDSSGFSGVFRRVAGINPQIEVIPAMNQTVYSLEIKVLDKKSSSPVSDVLVDVTGGKSDTKSAISINKLSDSEGSVRFLVHEGYYQVSFPAEMLPAGYKQPAPITVDVKTAGTTLVTIDLEQDKEILTGAGMSTVEADLNTETKPLISPAID